MVAWIRQHIEYPVGVLSAGVSSITLSNYFDITVNGMISIIFALLMIFVVHFAKRYLHTKYPIDDK